MNQSQTPQVQKLPTNVTVLILQHPQEPDKELGSASVIVGTLDNAVLKTGLSWPNLKAALGKPTDPSKWAVLYWGSGLKNEDMDFDLTTRQVWVTDKKGRILENQDQVSREIGGIIVLDGTWSQAKSLWWRNPWLLKLKRLVLIPKQKSLYGELRREPRRECLSSIESVALVLASFGEDKETTESLVNNFKALLNRFRK